LGIDTKVFEVSILSDEFRNNVDFLNKTPKSKASEMEHAIRWHIKVNLEKDPTLYARFKDKLETILHAYQENWEEIVKELGKLRDEMSEGRTPETDGISIIEAPFYDLIKVTLSIADETEINLTKELTHNLIEILKETATITNFWSDKSAERRRIEGLLEDEIRYSGIKGVSDIASELTTELMKLAKNRIADLK